MFDLLSKDKNAVCRIDYARNNLTSDLELASSHSNASLLSSVRLHEVSEQFLLLKGLRKR